MYNCPWHWYTLLVCLLVSPLSFGFGQNPSSVDSCLIIKERLQDLEVNIDKDPVAASKGAQDAMATDLTACDTDLRNRAKFLICNIVTSTIPIHESIQSCQEAFAYYQQANDQEKLGKILNKLGIHYDIGGQKDSSILCFQAAEKIFLELEDNASLGELYNNWGVVYSVSWDSPKALELYKKALEYNIESDNEIGHIASHTNIGRAHFRQKRYQEALNEFQKGLTLAKESQYPFWEATLLAFVAEIYFQKKSLKQAEATFLQAKVIAEENNNDYTTTYILNKLARIELARQNWQTALTYLEEASERVHKVGKKKDLAEINNLKAKAMIKMGLFQEAQISLDSALSQAKREDEKNHLAENFHLQAFLNAQKGEFEKAYYFQEKYAEYQDGILSYDNANLVAQLRNEYKDNQQKQQIFDLEQAATKQKLYLLSLAGFAVLIITILASVLLYYRGRKRLIEELEEKLEKQTKDLKRSNEELQRFAYITSHDLKTPLRNISSFAALVKRKITPYQDKELEELLSFVTDGAKQMNNLIEDILVYSQIGQGEQEPQTLVDLNETMTHVIENISNITQEQNATIRYSRLPLVWSSPSQMVQLFQNLILNGVKYNQNPAPEIKIQYQERALDYLISVQDNGIGIEEDFKDKIFKMFKRLHSSQDYEGSGIGLALCKKIVEQNQGEIWFDSTPGEGSIFYFTIKKRLSINQQLSNQSVQELS